MKNTLKKISAISLLAFTILFFSCSKTDMKQDKLSVYSDAKANSGKAERDKSEVATDWYELQLKIMLERNSAFNGVYWAYVGVGLFEAVKPGIRGASSFYGKLRGMPKMPDAENNQGYNYVICANAALADMTRMFFSGLTDANKKSIDDLEAKYNQQESPDMNSEVFKRSSAYGKAIAKATFNWSKTEDLVFSSAGYVPPVGPGKWIPTPPAFVNPPVNAFYGNATTMVASLHTAIAKPFPYAYSENPNSDFYKMVKQVYDQKNSNTPEQIQIALHWVDQGNGIGYTPPGHQFSIIAQGIQQAGLSLAVAAETLAKAGIGERDGSILVFRSKYANNLIRPISYIRAVIDPAWNTVFPTPPHPEYPAAHAGVTGSALLSAATVVGDAFPIDDKSYVFRGFPVQHYATLMDAVHQAGISRNYGGIHYLISIDEGTDLGKKVAEEVGKIKVID